MTPHASALGALCALLIAGGGAASAESVRAVVSIPPVATLVERIGGDHVAVVALVPPGQDPHTFAPTPRQVAALAKSRLYFSIGLPFETQVVRRIERSGGIAVVDVAQGVTRRSAPPHAHEADDHSCDHGPDDPHVWLSPEALGVIASNVAAALVKADPEHAADYEENLKVLREEIAAVDVRIAALLKPWQGRTIYVYHPALGYFCQRYGLVQKAVEIRGKGPTPRQLRELVRQARAEEVKVIFVQKQFDQRAARTVAGAIGGRVEAMDPLAADVLGNLESLARAIDASMRE